MRSCCRHDRQSAPEPTAVTHLFAFAWPLVLALFHFAGSVPIDLGLHNEQLRACPSTAHCALRSWKVDDTAAAMTALEQQLQTTPGTTVETHNVSDGYLHATATSRLFGFVDDIELLSNPDLGVIEARSESRLGDSDLGVNSRRLDQLAAALHLSDQA